MTQATPGAAGVRLTEAQRRYLAEMPADVFRRATNPPQVGMWRKLASMGMADTRIADHRGFPTVEYRQSDAGRAALTPEPPR